MRHQTVLCVVKWWFVWTYCDSGDEHSRVFMITGSALRYNIPLRFPIEVIMSHKCKNLQARTVIHGQVPMHASYCMKFVSFNLSLIYWISARSTSESTFNPTRLFVLVCSGCNLMLYFCLFEPVLRVLFAWSIDLSLPTVCDYSLLVLDLFYTGLVIISRLLLFMRAWVATDPKDF